LATIDRATAQQVTEEIAEAIAPILQRHGMETRKQSTKFGTTYSLKIDAHKVELDETGVNRATQEAQDFLMYAGSGLIPLPPDALGSTFVSKGVSYQLTGYMPQNPKFCYQVKRVSDGAGFKFGEHLEKLIQSQQ